MKWIARTSLVLLALVSIGLVVVGVLAVAEQRGWGLALAVFPGMPLAAIVLVVLTRWAVHRS